MHISLDSALGRQKRLNSVGESVLQIAPDAAAAYSLRSLTGGDPDVVRVRRESDNTEKDFSGSQIESGEMARWVNEQPTLPLDLRELDTNTGERDGALIEAAAAYSLRKLKEDFTGDVVEVRRNVDGETEGFTAAEVTDGTLESFVNASFDDELPLDQATGAAAAYSLRNLSSSYTGNVVEVRRSSDDAVQSFTASEVADGTLTDWVNVGNDYVGYARFQDASTANVNLSSSFTLEASKSWSIKFECIVGEFPAGLFGKSDFSNGGFWFANPTTVGLTDDSDSYQALPFGTGLALNVGQNYELEFFNTPSEGVRVAVDGTTMSTTPKVYGDITINKIGVSRGRAGERVIHNVRVDLNGDGTLDYSYAGDGNQASNWIDRVGSNNGTPTAQVLAYDNEYTDGHVRTWYDQSGSDNHAVQTDTAKQPKIVEDGVLVTGGIDFDGSDDELASEASVDIAQLATAFSVVKPEDAGANKYIWTIGGTSGIISFLKSSEEAALAAGSPLVDGTLSTVDDNLKFDFCNTTSSIVAINGSSGTSGTIGTRSGNDVIRIGGRGGADLMSGTIREIIIYNSDQSTKRRAIEENIANHYDISLEAFSRDGTVSTWYDQSGNTPANDATQTDPTKQPKIVEGGNLLKDSNNKPEIDFDGTDDYFDLTSNIGFQGGGGCVISLQDPQSGASTATLGSASSSRLISFPDDSARWYFTTNAIDVNSSTTVSGLTLFTINHDGTTNEPNVKAFRDGSLMVATTPDPHQGEANTSTVANQIGARRDLTYFSGVLKELIIYTTDQSDNRTAIEANIGETYGITDIPAANDTVNGYVQTWYDQSGSGNDAEQISATKQPKIVDAGSLVKRNNNPAVESTSDNSLSFTLDSLSADGQQSVFAVLENDVTSQHGFSAVFRAQSTSSTTGGANRRPWWFVNPTGGLAFTVDSTSGYQNSDRNYRLYSHIMNDDGGGTSTIHRDGTQVDTRAIALDANSTFLDGKMAGVNINATGALYMSEVIYYTDDQSSNRPAIEANIANQYGITLS